MGVTKKMIDTEFEQEMLQIEAILEESQIYNLRIEVHETAKKLLTQMPELTLLEAYKIAYEEWIK